jgi:hypothetical protein
LEVSAQIRENSQENPEEYTPRLMGSVIYECKQICATLNEPGKITQDELIQIAHKLLTMGYIMVIYDEPNQAEESE